MILINKMRSVPITHKCNQGRVGKIMTAEEIHEFGVSLLVVYLYYQSGQLISANHNPSNEYPHIVARNPNDELLYIWVKTEIYPNIPRVEAIENPLAVITLAKKFNATPVFAGIVLQCISTEENNIPINGGHYIAEFTGFKAIDIGS